MKTQRIAIQFVGLACMLLLSTSLFAADPPATAAREKAAAAKKSVPPEIALTRRIPRIDFNGVKFEDVITYIQELTNTNVVVRWHQLAMAGINGPTEVSLCVKDVDVETALKLILSSFPSVGPEQPPAYVIKDGVLIISTADDLREITTEVYDVSGIVEGADPSEVAGLVKSLTPIGVTKDTDVQLIKGSLIVSADKSQHEKIRKMIDQINKNQANRAQSPRALARQSQDQIKTILSMKDTCFDPQAMCVVALGCLRSETKETPAQLGKTLEALLAETKAVGVRNAIRMTLKDLYGQMGRTDMVKVQLEGIIKDNAQAVLGKPGLSSGLGGPVESSGLGGPVE